MKIGIIGNGFVGKATRQLECSNIEIYCFDIQPQLCVPVGITFEQLLECQIIFISVPTPMRQDGSCHLNIVENIVKDLNTHNYQGFVVVRSTVPVGTCDKLQCRFMPEFLTEANFINDFISCPEWIFGTLGEDAEFKECIKYLLREAKNSGKILHDNTVFLTNSEAEMVKLFRNCYLATKVAFCNEMWEFCQNKGVNYDNMIEVASRDKRIGSSHTKVPGPDGRRGFGGTCFPKDMGSLLYQMQSSNQKSYVVEASIKRNVEVDRSERDWEQNKGRAFL